MKGISISGKIENFRFEAATLKDLFHEFQMAGVDLVGAFGFHGIEGEVEADLVGLAYDRAGAWYHFANVVMQDAGEVFEVGIAPGDEVFKGVGFGGIDVEGDDVGEHSVS